MSEQQNRSRPVKGLLMAMATVALALWVGALVWSSRAGPEDESSDAGRMPAARIDINAADAGKLQVLPSIGPTLSRRIVDDRKLNGPYRRPKDLLRVKGITKELLRRVEPFLSGFQVSEAEADE